MYNKENSESRALIMELHFFLLRALNSAFDTQKNYLKFMFKIE